jgi:hypothetical protein
MAFIAVFRTPARRDHLFVCHSLPGIFFSSRDSPLVDEGGIRAVIFL